MDLSKIKPTEADVQPITDNGIREWLEKLMIETEKIGDSKKKKKVKK